MQLALAIAAASWGKAQAVASDAQRLSQEE